MTTQTTRNSNSAILGDYVEALFGGLVPESNGVTVQLTHSLTTTKCHLQTWQVQTGTPHGLRWSLWLERPLAHDLAEGFPCLLSPDACWPHCLTDEARQHVLASGVALAYFNRLEIAHDGPDGRRAGPIFDCWPDARWGAISAWAWAIQRSAEALRQIGCHAGQLGVIGHSRSGKAALLAAATHSALALTVAHNSGTAGAASFQVQGPGAETLRGLQSAFPHWLGSQTGQPEVQHRIEAIDNGLQLQAIFPRQVCFVQALDDAWSNPVGSRSAFEQLQAHYAAQGLGHNVHWTERTGGHAMTPQVWQHAARRLADMSVG